MLEKGMSLDEIAENLNLKGVRAPHGRGTWSAATVRKAFVITPGDGETAAEPRK